MFSFRSQRTRTRTRTLTGLVTAATGVLCLATAASAFASGSTGGSAGAPSNAGSAAARSVHKARPWSYQATAGQSRYNVAQAVAQAKQFDVIAGNRFAYRDMAGAMHQANGQLQLLAYVNGAYAQKTEGTAFPDSWYLRNADGGKVRSVGWGNYLMDVANPGWIQSVADRCLFSMHHFGYDGCFIDMMGTASVMSFWTDGAPVDPRTGQHFTPSEWLDMTSALARKVHFLVGGQSPVYLNGLGGGPRYFAKDAPSSQLLNGVDGALAESWLRGAAHALSWHPTEKQWKQNVDMLSDVSARGKAALVT
ncbi:MAG: putative glycosyl hydrolase family 15, partial [Nocardioidaceae bacterium]|nr:putative glycosyl hydrolase family 15 [Nocardioidaceae bacterium]